MQHEYITSTHRYRSEVKFSNVPGGIFVMSSDERSLEENQDKPQNWTSYNTDIFRILGNIQRENHLTKG